MVRRNFKIGGLETSNINISANGFATTLTANATLASNVSFSLPGADGNSGQVLATDGGGNLFFADSSANTQAYVGDTLLSNTALILEAGEGVSVSGNTTSGVVSFSTSMSNVTSQVISVDGSANSFSLTKSVSNSHMVLVSYNGLLQDPTTYSVSETTLTISNSKPLLADSTIEVRYFDFFSLPGATAGSPVPSPAAWSYPGENFGYSSGGYSAGVKNTIDKFPFSSDTDATDVGDAVFFSYNLAGQSSSTSGYISGGIPSYNALQKFPFSSDTNAIDIAELVQPSFSSAGHSSSTHGYHSGGRDPSIPAYINSIQKFPFSSDSNSVDVGEMTLIKYGAAGHSSDSYGYGSGGRNPPQGNHNDIDKFPFTSDSSSVFVGDLTRSVYDVTGTSSDTNGYTSGGLHPAAVDTIDKFSFTSDGNSTDIGELNVITYRTQAGQSSTTSGYVSGGRTPTVTYAADIKKFPFASDTPSATVGSLTQGRYGVSGQQY